jgi:hypothetical protein
MIFCVTVIDYSAPLIKNQRCQGFEVSNIEVEAHTQLEAEKIAESDGYTVMPV